MTFITDYDLHLLGEGTHRRLYEKMGAHVVESGGKRGTHFSVWAPNAESVSVIGDFNDWDVDTHPMRLAVESGVWQLFVPGLDVGTLYKYHIKFKNGGESQKTDPFSFFCEVRPKTASIVFELEGYEWGDAQYLSQRQRNKPLHEPVSIYEVHLGSWMRMPEENDRWLTYIELADKLSEYCHRLGYTHVELLPIAEHPLDSSWGYQTVGFFAPTSRFGNPHDFMHFVDRMHQKGIGVIVDWVGSHYPRDGHGLGLFDGTHLYEHADPRKGEHKEWGTYVFNYGRHEVSSFLISNALFWFDKYHIDGLRVDAVASMLYLDYGRKDGEWLRNDFGGNENLDAINFLKSLNAIIYSEYPDSLIVAEESTAWPQVSRPTYIGGLGFGFKWDMGWMHDTLSYMQLEPIYRKFHHNRLTFRGLYAFSENFVMPLSHDEVVYGKRSLLSKMPGDLWQQFANLRLLMSYMYSLPGKKLLFMGGEFGQRNEWYHEVSLDWHLLQYHEHQGLQDLNRDLNQVYRREKALHELDCDPRGFEWIDCQDVEQGVLSFMRKGSAGEVILVAGNFTPVPRHNYMLGVPRGGFWREIFNSDATVYGGSGQGNMGGIHSNPIQVHARPEAITVTLPPLGLVMFKHEG